MLVYEHKCVTSVLEAVFEQRRRRNPNYSLRAFARDIDLAPSSISEVLSAGAVLSSRRVVAVAHKLGLSQTETDYLVALADLENAKSAEERDRALARLQVYNYDAPDTHIRSDQFAIYSEWEPLTIVSLLSLSSKPRTIDWLCEALDASQDIVKHACELLLRNDFIAKDENGMFTSLRERSSSVRPSGDPMNKLIVRKYHRALLSKASDALWSQPLEERDFSAMTYATSKTSTPRVKEAIKEFRRALVAEGESLEVKDSVYCLSIQWFKLAEAPSRD